MGGAIEGRHKMRQIHCECFWFHILMLPEELEHTQNAKCDVARVQRGGVVADFALVHPLQVEAGPEDGE